jgi:hypothetical protein
LQSGNETTVEEWEERFREDVRRRPGWSVLAIEVLFSQAYRSLSGSAQLALQFALSQVSWEKSKRPGKRKRLKNDTIYLPTNALKALGIKSSATRTALRKELVEKGFLDVKTTGSYLNCGVFKISGRWRHYPNGDYQPQNQPAPGLSMGNRFKSKEEEENTDEDFLRSKNERKGCLIFKRKEIDENTDIGSSLRLKNERKPLRLENERNVICTKERSDGKDVQVQEDNEDEISSDEGIRAIETDSESEVNESQSLTVNLPTTNSMKHAWFLETFEAACREKDVVPNLDITPALTSTLEEWLDKRLGKFHFLGNRKFFDEKPYVIKEKLAQIISQWDFIEIYYLGERIEVPPLPDLEFLITNRESIFSWIGERRDNCSMAIRAQYLSQEEAVPAGY